MAIIELKTEEFDKAASENELFILDFYKDNCGPCAALRGVLEDISPLEGTPQIYAVDRAVTEKIGKRAKILFGYAISSGNECPICGNYFKWVLEDKLGITDFDHFEFTDEEVELIDFAAALVKDPNHVPDSVYEPLQERYDEETLVLIITTAVLTLANNYWNNIVGTNIDDYLYEGNYVDRELDIQKAVKANK